MTQRTRSYISESEVFPAERIKSYVLKEDVDCFEIAINDLYSTTHLAIKKINDSIRIGPKLTRNSVIESGTILLYSINDFTKKLDNETYNAGTSGHSLNMRIISSDTIDEFYTYRGFGLYILLLGGESPTRTTAK